MRVVAIAGPALVMGLMLVGARCDSEHDSDHDGAQSSGVSTPSDKDKDTPTAGRSAQPPAKDGSGSKPKPGSKPPSGPKCGSNTCQSGEVCCNESCGVCTKPGQGCTKQLCPPEEADAGVDAGEQCGRSTCAAGQVCCNASCGICTDPGGVCTQQACEEPPPSGEAPMCGGFAGLPCPGAGSCMDDPSDSCDPKKGGADCGGRCECLAKGLCVGGSVWDDSPAVCGCVPAVDACATVRCRAGAQCVVQPDGSAKCEAPSGPPCGAGAGCPGLGQCMDDATDDCDPARDKGCGGVCTCEALAKCKADQEFDSNPEVCACIDPVAASCAAVLCPRGTHCEEQAVQCIRAPCPAQAMCVPN